MPTDENSPTFLTAAPSSPVDHTHSYRGPERPGGPFPTEGRRSAPRRNLGGWGATRGKRRVSCIRPDFCWLRGSRHGHGWHWGRENISLLQDAPPLKPGSPLEGNSTVPRASQGWGSSRCILGAPSVTVQASPCSRAVKKVQPRGTGALR